MKTELTAARLRELLHYNPETGVFTWRVERRCGRGRVTARVGDAAGAADGQTGYLRIGIDYGKFHAHRLAWMHVHGYWPQGDIDHINGIRIDNRLANLRDVPHAANLQNRSGLAVNNTSGFTGVYRAPSGRWFASITVNCRGIHLGTFNTLAQAASARLNAQRKHHPGFVDRHG